MFDDWKTKIAVDAQRRAARWYALAMQFDDHELLRNHAQQTAAWWASCAMRDMRALKGE